MLNVLVGRLELAFGHRNAGIHSLVNSLVNLILSEMWNHLVINYPTASCVGNERLNAIARLNGYAPRLVVGFRLIDNDNAVVEAVLTNAPALAQPLAEVGNVVAVQVGCGVNQNLRGGLTVEGFKFFGQSLALLVGEGVGIINHKRLLRWSAENIVIGKGGNRYR